MEQVSLNIKQTGSYTHTY